MPKRVRSGMREPTVFEDDAERVPLQAPLALLGPPALEAWLCSRVRAGTAGAQWGQMVAGQLPALVNGRMSQQGRVRERCTRCARSPGGLLAACPAQCEKPAAEHWTIASLSQITTFFPKH